MIIKTAMDKENGAPVPYILFDTTDDYSINDVIDRIKDWLHEEWIDEPTIGFGKRSSREQRATGKPIWHWWMVFNDFGRAVDLDQGEYLIKDKENRFWALTEEKFNERFEPLA